MKILRSSVFTMARKLSDEDAQKLGDDLAALYPNAEVEVHAGGQPIYYYVISVE